MCLIPVLPAAPPATSPALSTISVCSAHPHVPPVLDQSLIAQPAPHHSHSCLLTLMLGHVLPRVHLGSMVTPHCQCPCVWLVSLPVRHAQPRQCVWHVLVHFTCIMECVPTAVPSTLPFRTMPPEYVICVHQCVQPVKTRQPSARLVQLRQHYTMDSVWVPALVDLSSRMASVRPVTLPVQAVSRHPPTVRAVYRHRPHRTWSTIPVWPPVHCSTIPTMESVRSVQIWT